MRLVPTDDREPAGQRIPAGDASGQRGGGPCDLRCGCGSLLARRIAAGVELKCRRCKRTLVLPLTEG